jgi:hypothetical protein
MSDVYKNKGGHPPIIENAEEMQKKVEEYFTSLMPTPILDKDGRAIETDKGRVAYTKERKPSVVGLALFLGYESRQSFYDNIKKEEFSYILKRARSKVELGVLDNGMDEKIPQSLTIFLLKQFGYSDKPEQVKANFDEDISILDKLVNGEG